MLKFSNLLRPSTWYKVKLRILTLSMLIDLRLTGRDFSVPTEHQ